jgi:hypothetical protein
MIALADIKAALVAILETIPNVDTVNGYGWFQDLTAASIGITIPPLRTQSLYGFTMSHDGPDFQSHRFFCEVWVLDDGDPKALDAAMTGINTDAVTTLMSNQEFMVDGAKIRLGWWDGDRYDYSLTFEVEEGWRRLVNDGPTYLVATLSIPVTDR